MRKKFVGNKDNSVEKRRKRNKKFPFCVSQREKWTLLLASLLLVSMTTPTHRQRATTLRARQQAAD